MREIILEKLLELEQSENIKILYACESGSRAWGFASPDSDYDVRFIYARPVNDYLGITDLPDNVGLPVNEVLDIAGWDIKKALKLFLKSNSTLYEWLQSPVVYQQTQDFAGDLHKLMPAFYSLRPGANHYLSMAHNTLRDDLQGEQVKLKRYFYALRPGLACKWIIERQTVPPMEFSKLRTIISDNEIHNAIDELLEQKKVADEKALITPVPVLNEWLSNTIEWCKEQIPALPNEKRNTDRLNEFFRKHIMQ